MSRDDTPGLEDGSVSPAARRIADIVTRAGALAGAPLGGGLVWRTRLILFGLYALIHARFIVTSVSSGQPVARIAIVSWLLVCIGLVAWRPPSAILASLVLAPVVSQLGLLGLWEGVASAFLPFSCAALVWIVHRLATRARAFAEVPLLGWVADSLGLLIVVKSAVALVTPSLQNSLWRLAILPSDFPYSDMQAMNVGFSLVCMLCLFGILAVESRAQQDTLPPLLTALALQVGLVSAFALAQGVLGVPALTRNGVHAPFVGIHEMGFYAASMATFFVLTVLDRPGRWMRRVALPAFAASAAMLGASFSRTGWAAAAVVMAAWLAFARARVGVLLLAGSSLAAAVALLVADGSFHGPSNRQRVSLFAKAGVLAARRPLDGIGIGDFRITDDERTRALVGWIPPVARRDHDAHNILLNLASEAGLGAAMLFLLLVGGTIVVGLATSGQPIGKAAAAAVATGFLFNLVNCVVTWPWQGLTFGLLLAVPLACNVPHVTDGQGRRSDPRERPPRKDPESGVRWPAPVLLLPAVVAILLSPWSVARDRELQGASYGFFRWEWFPPGPDFVSCQPDCRLRLDALVPIAAVSIQPVSSLRRTGNLRLDMNLNRVPVFSGTSIPREGIVVPVHLRAGDSLTVELKTGGLWKVWRWGLPQSDTWRLELLDARGVRLKPPVAVGQPHRPGS